MENRNLTIMLTDMKGFTPRTSAQSRSATMDMLREHKTVLLPVIEKRGGRLIKTIGDAFLVTFESPTDAVLTGMALQETLRAHNAAKPEAERIEIRVAINTGEVTVDEGDIFGEAVNIAARIEGIAEANEIYFTESTYLAMNKSEVPSAEIGYRVLKGIPHKIKVYRVLHEGEAPPASAPDVFFDTAAGTSSVHGASPWKRAAALAIDLLLVILLTFVLISAEKKDVEKRRVEIKSKMEAAGYQTPDDIPLGDPLRDEVHAFRKKKQQAGQIPKKRAGAVSFMLFVLYSTVAVGWKGRTLGKHLMKLRVVRMDGTAPGFGRALVRAILYYLSAAPFFLGFIWVFFDTRRLAWHDKISETAVVEGATR